MSRRGAIKGHALKRARERLDVLPDGATIKRIVRLIRRRLRRPKGRPLNDVIIECPPNRRCNRVVASCRLDDRRYRVVYEPASDLIVTWLPVE